MTKNTEEVIAYISETFQCIVRFELFKFYNPWM